MTSHLQHNVGALGISVRLVLGIALLAMGVYVFASWADWFVVSIVGFAMSGYLIMTAAIAYDPLLS